MNTNQRAYCQNDYFFLSSFFLSRFKKILPNISGILTFIELDGVRYFYYIDATHTVRGLFNSDGELLVRYSYDAWGNVTNIIDYSSISLSTLNPFLFKCYYYDHESKWYYCLSRYYVPLWMRWLSIDDSSYLTSELPAGYNLYVYCNNNPIMYEDNNGNFVITGLTILTAALIGAAAGAIIGGVAGGITATANGQNIWHGVGIGALGGAIMGAGAGVGALFLAPIIAGEGIMIATAVGESFFMGNAISTGLAVGIGLGVSASTGIIGGGLSNMLNQLSSGIKVDSLDWNSIALGAIGSGFLNMFSASLAGFGGPDLSWGINFILSLQLNVIPSGYDSIINLIKHYLQNKAN
jgi:RHS repeat-associated protein